MAHRLCVFGGKKERRRKGNGKLYCLCLPLLLSLSGRGWIQLNTSQREERRRGREGSEKKRKKKKKKKKDEPHNNPSRADRSIGSDKIKREEGTIRIDKASVHTDRPRL